MRPPFPLLPGVDAPELPATETGPYRAPRARVVACEDLPAFARDWVAELRAMMLANPFDEVASSARPNCFGDFLPRCDLPLHDIPTALERVQAMMEGTQLVPPYQWYNRELLDQYRASQLAYLPRGGV